MSYNSTKAAYTDGIEGLISLLQRVQFPRLRKEWKARLGARSGTGFSNPLRRVPVAPVTLVDLPTARWRM